MAGTPKKIVNEKGKTVGYLNRPDLCQKWWKLRLTAAGLDSVGVKEFHYPNKNGRLYRIEEV